MAVVPISESNKNRTNKTHNFAHPSEEFFAQILDFYGIEWVYEPRTFPLEWDEKGAVTQAFTPDFYLPDQDLFIELTTLKPELSTHKNRKLLRIKELYPDIKIKLLKRKEMRDLMIKYGMIHKAEQIRGSKSQREEIDG